MATGKESVRIRVLKAFLKEKKPTSPVDLHAKYFSDTELHPVQSAAWSLSKTELLEKIGKDPEHPQRILYVITKSGKIALKKGDLPPARPKTARAERKEGAGLDVASDPEALKLAMKALTAAVSKVLDDHASIKSKLAKLSQ